MKYGKGGKPSPNPKATKKAVKASRPAKGLSKAMAAEQKKNKKNKPF